LVLTADNELMKMWHCINFLSSGSVFILTNAVTEMEKDLHVSVPTVYYKNK